MSARLAIGGLLVGLIAAGLAGASAGSPAAPAQLPPSARVGHGGIRAELSVPAAEGQIWRVRVYRARRSASAPHVVPGSVDLCMAVDQGGKRWRGIACGLSASIGLHLQRRGLWLECGAFGQILGEPAQPGPTCGLVDASVQQVAVATPDQPAQIAALSQPFRIRVNRSRRVLYKHRVDARRVRSLPRELSLRAFLAFLDTPPTPVGRRTPRITVTGTRADGGTVTGALGGAVVPEPPERPRLRPPPGAKRARLSATGPDGRHWTSVAWRQPDGVLCANAGGTRPTSLGCHGSLQVIDQFFHGGVVPYVDGEPSRAGYAVYGTVRGDAEALTIRAPGRQVQGAELSRVWTRVRRHTGNHLKRFRKLPRSMTARSFLAVLPGSPPAAAPGHGPPGHGLEFRTRLTDGRVLVRRL